MSEVSQNGWPLVPAGATVDTIPIDEVRARRFHLVNRKGMTVCDIWLRDGVTGFILAWVILTIDARIEKVKPAFTGGYNVRKISGSDEWSNHSSATAADVNWQDHPQHKVNTFTLIQRTKIRFMMNRLCGVVRWGGTFNHPWEDEMHWEINTRVMATLIVVAHKLAKTRRGKRIMRSNPGLYKAVFQ